MAPTPPPFIADFDSATAMVRTTAPTCAARTGRRSATRRGSNRSPRGPTCCRRRLREKVFIAGGAMETISPKKLADLDLDELVDWLEEEYPKGRSQAVAVGSSNGAAVHLHAALGAPWLPQTVFLPVRQKVHPDDPKEAMEKGIEPGRALLDANPDWQLHHMHDANQDRLMVRALTYFRVKRRSLGDRATSGSSPTGCRPAGPSC
jgi:hypothetical protein